jgi:hypothetical protein
MVQVVSVDESRLWKLAASGEWILDPQFLNFPSVLEVFAVELPALAFQRRRNHQRVIP